MGELWLYTSSSSMDKNLRRQQRAPRERWQNTAQVVPWESQQEGIVAAGKWALLGLNPLSFSEEQEQEYLSFFFLIAVTRDFPKDASCDGQL